MERPGPWSFPSENVYRAVIAAETNESVIGSTTVTPVKTSPQWNHNWISIFFQVTSKMLETPPTVQIKIRLVGYIPNLKY